MPKKGYYALKAEQAMASSANAVAPSAPPTQPAESSPDVEEAFEMYAQFVGDVPKTAAALKITPTAVLEMAAEHKWNERLKDLFELKKAGKPGDIERALNRAMNFVIANQYRSVLHRIVKRLHKLNDDELMDEVCIVKVDKDGNETKSFNSKAMADLATAIEKMNTCTYVALNDSVTERGHKKDHGETGLTLGAIHQVISQSIADSQNSAKRGDFAEKLAQAQKVLQG